MKVWDLENEKAYKKGKLQKNIDHLYKKYGSRFDIQYQGIRLPAKLYYKRIKHKDNQKLYYFEYYVPYFSKRLKPFQIKFMDYFTKDINNNAEIFWIGKVDKNEYPEIDQNISGFQIVRFVIQICKVLGVDELSIRDNVKVKCGSMGETLLSPFKLLEKRKTYYMNFGFMPKLTDDHTKYYKNMSSLEKYLTRSIRKIKKYKIGDIYTYYKQAIFVYQMCKRKKMEKNMYYLLKSEPIDHSSKYPSYTIIPKEKEDSYMIHYKKWIKEFSHEKNTNTLWSWLKRTFIHDCPKYDSFINMVNRDIYGILYRGKILKNPFYELFLTLEIYKDCVFTQRL